MELGKHHYAAHRLSARVGGAVLVWLGIAVVLRFILLPRRSAREQRHRNALASRQPRPDGIEHWWIARGDEGRGTRGAYDGLKVGKPHP